MLKKMIERSVRKQIALNSLKDKTSSVIVEHMKHERREKEKAIAEVLELKEKLEASDRREKSLHKELEHYSKELFDLRNKFKEWTDPNLATLSPREEAIMKLNTQFGKPFDFVKAMKPFTNNEPIVLFEKPQPITWDKFMKQSDSITDNLDDDVNNLLFYTLEYSVDGQQESLFNLSLHDCEELYGQIIGSLEYFKITKQEKFVEEVNNLYRVYGTTNEGKPLYYGGFKNLNNLVNDLVMNPNFNKSKETRFYKNGKRFAVLNGGLNLFCTVNDIKDELARLEKEIEQ